MTPPENWLKHDNGVLWNKSALVNGVYWILRNGCDRVIMHGRSSVVNIQSKLQAQGKDWLWVLEGMKSFRLNNVFLVKIQYC